MQFQNKLHKLAMSSKFNLMLVLLLTICTTRNTIIAYLINGFNLVLAYVGIICSLMLIASLLLRGNALKEQILQRLQNEASSLFSDLEDELVTSTQNLEGNEIIKEECKQN